MEYQISIGLIVVGVLMLAVISYLALSVITAKRREWAKKLQPKPKMLIEAEKLLAAENFQLSFIKSFGALEYGLKHSAQKPGEQLTAFELIQRAEADRIWPEKLIDAVHAVRIKRNQALHEGAHISAEDAQHALDTVRHALNQLGYQIV